VALFRPALGAAFLFCVAALGRPASLVVGVRGLVVIGVGGGAAVALFQVAYQLSMDAVGVPTTVALLYLAPAMVVAASGPVLGEWPSRMRVALAALTIAGVWITVLGAETVPTTYGTSGSIWGVLAAVGYAAYTLFGRFAAPTYGSFRTVVYSSTGAACLLAVILPFFGPPPLPPDARAWGVLVMFAVLTVAIAQFLFFDALRRVEASVASIAAAAEPAVAALLATVLLAQGLRPLGWLGIALVMGGVVGLGVAEGRERAAA
jgi:DME family drug/metabolite transporter